MTMSTMAIREQLYRQIERLPDDIVEQIADFTFFVMERRHIAPSYADWEDHQWESFALGQFLRDDDDIEYSLEDARV